MKLESFDDVLASIKRNKNRQYHLLLGNGFSMAYDPKIFSYDALQNVVKGTDNEILAKLFSVTNINNFEILLQQLETFELLLEVFSSDSVLKNKVTDARNQLRKVLVDSIKSLHPEHVFNVSDEDCDSCAYFLKIFRNTKGHIFTTNYDLLLYWVLMRSTILEAVDGFGRERVNIDDFDNDPEYSELRWGKYRDLQDVHYLHGALPLFDTGVEIVKEEYDTKHYLLENISERVDRGEYPIFVTAGNPRDKLIHIMHNRYLTYCYEQLEKVEGSLVVYGFNFGKYDEHIVEAINKAANYGMKSPSRLWSIYISVYSDADRKHIEHISGKFKCKVHIFDARSAKVWS